MTILPSFMVISCSSIGEAGDAAAVMVIALSVSLTRTPNAAVIAPASAAFTQGSLIVSVLAAAGAEVAAGAGAAAVSPLPQPVRAKVVRAAARATAVSVLC